MTFTSGSRIGTFQIKSALGEGGMGVVYRALDTKLQRDVALKLLPDHLSNSPERLAWFQREALVLASLNHPNIAQIYGLEDSTDSRCIVMELVEGETLADLLTRGAIPAHDVMPIAVQIATALEAAHEKGIIHRDLKPANIKVTPDGIVKVLDFGLAKAFEDTSQSDPGNSPTLSMATQAGVIIGTAGYMSPEQASGKPADKRSDVWSFGVVLFEMLTGGRLFEGGETIAHTLADVLRAPIDLARLPAGTPRVARDLVTRCLDRNVKNRLRDIGEARIALENAAKTPEAVAALERPQGVRSLRRIPLVVYSLAVLGLAATAAFAGLGWWRATRPVDHALMRFTDDLGSELFLSSPLGPGIAISPDGLRIAYLSPGSDGQPHLFTRLVGSSKATLLSGADSPNTPPSSPFFSPEGQWIGFFNAGKLRKISVDGGSAVTLCDAGSPQPRGGFWGEDGNILFAIQRSPIMRVAATGGTPVVATELAKDEVTNRFAQTLPGGEAFIFTASKDNNIWEDATIVVQEVKSGKRKILLTGGYFGRYVASDDGSGYLLYMHEGTAFGAPMDLKTLALTGPASPVIEDVGGLPANGFPHLAVSGKGSVIFVAGANIRDRVALAFLDPKGGERILPAMPGDYRAPVRPSPSGNRIAIRSNTPDGDNLFVYEVPTNRMTQVTFIKGAVTNYPTWTPDEKHIAFFQTTNAGTGIYWMRADGAGEPQLLLATTFPLTPYSFSPDGKRLAYARVQGPEYEIWTMPLDLSDPEHPKPAAPDLFLKSKTTLEHPMFSPDGKWLAYTSLETQTQEIFVRPFAAGSPVSGGKWQISSGGGSLPIWNKSGELFYNNNIERRGYVVTYSANDNSFAASTPKVWSEIASRLAGAPHVMPDGKQYIGIRPAAETAVVAPRTHLTFLLNLGDDLRRRLNPVR